MLGGTGVSVAGNPGTNTLTINATSSVPVQFTEDSGTATPAANNLNVFGQAGFLETTGAGDTITVGFTDDSEATAVHSWNGSILETADVSVASDGATVTLSIEQSGGGDLTVVFSDGFYIWDTSPADTVTLTAGSDTSPQINYVYFLQSTKTLIASTTGFPSSEHAAVAEVLCQSAASLQTEGAYIVQSYTDHVVGMNNNGHVPHINYWIRQQPATWESGVQPTFTITPNVGTPDNVLLTTASGIVLQLHEHSFPAFGPTPDYYVVNDSVTPYTIVNDLNALLTDANGGSMENRFFGLVIWGVVNEDASDCKLMVNLPTGSYASAMEALEDAQGYSVYTIPSDFTGVGFLIAEWRLGETTASGGTWTSIQEIDLRGQFPSKAAGGTGMFPTEFADNTFRIYDEGDSTKKLAFQISPVTTSTTRTITMVDADLDLAEVATDFVSDSGTATPAANTLKVQGAGIISTSGAGDTLTISASGATAASFPTDSGTAVPAANALTVAGGNLVNTSGAGSTVTVNADDAVAASFVADSGSATPSSNALNILGAGAATTSASGSTVTVSVTGGGFTWNEVTGTSQAIAVDNGYVANNAGTVTFTLPATAAFGDSFRIAGKGAGGWDIDQNAGQTIHYLGSSTTTGVTGNLAADEATGSVEVICITADTDFRVISSIGNFTLT